MASAAIEVAAGLVFHEGRLLITQRPTTGHLANLWEFPGGKREPGETFEECLRRELKEELGIQVIVGYQLAEVAHSYPEKVVSLRFFRCGWTGGEPSTIGCQDFKWITPQELGAFQFPAADRQILEELATSPDWWR